MEVRLAGGSRWGATLYTPEGVRAILDVWRRRGGERAGLYFWVPDVIIRELPPLERIVTRFEALLTENEHELVFLPLEAGPKIP